MQQRGADKLLENNIPFQKRGRSESFVPNSIDLPDPLEFEKIKHLDWCVPARLREKQIEQGACLCPHPSLLGSQARLEVQVSKTIDHGPTYLLAPNGSFHRGTGMAG